ncbi:MAG: glyoxalase [Bacteroidetes bacterium HGW-Bacteroidetes-23]|jgi:vesicle coat complex subunit|nr:MAG: glyoxalase [Bacteroidetes bacterium HGW-Bacteroidetes-23]PKP25802.1 MAG: glyoxalase [Bacteroidetes bacterium HGW-Bacteroidetes-2]
MLSRDIELLALRPEISSAIVRAEMSLDEKFQNKSLRPIIKLQNDLLLASFRNYINKYKNGFYTLSIEKRMDFIENAIQKDIKFRNALKGMIIGQFTLEEFDQYIQNSSALNKRMMHLVIERIKNNIQLLEYEYNH